MGSAAFLWTVNRVAIAATAGLVCLAFFHTANATEPICSASANDSNPVKPGQPVYAGRVLFVQGPVTARLRDAQPRTLSKNDPVCEGDTIESGESATAQLNMADGGKLALRPKTRMTIDTFANPRAQDGSENFAVSLVVGGLRAITGLIGKANKERYKINTPTVVIGIRGTDHEVFFVPASALPAARVAEAGSYNRVFSGGTYMQSADGRLNLAANQIGFAPLKGAPVLLKALPNFLGALPTEIRGALQEQEETQAAKQAESEETEQAAETVGQEAASESVAATDETASEQTDAAASAESEPADEMIALSDAEQTEVAEQEELQDAVTDQQTDVSEEINDIVVPVEIAIGNITVDLNASADATEPAPFGTAYAGASMILVDEAAGTFIHGTTTDDQDSNLHLDANTYAPAVVADGTGNFVYESKRANLLDYGYAEVDGAVAIWGLYDGGTVDDPTTADAAAVNFHHFAYAWGGVTPPEVIAGIKGSVQFKDVVGYTQPTTDGGYVGGTLHKLDVNLELGAMPGVTSYAIQVEDALARNWSGEFKGFTSLSEFAAGRLYLDARCDGSGCGSGVGGGSAAGLLIGNSAKGLITTYGLGTTTGQGVAGAAVLSRP